MLTVPDTRLRGGEIVVTSTVPDTGCVAGRFRRSPCLIPAVAAVGDLNRSRHRQRIVRHPGLRAGIVHQHHALRLFAGQRRKRQYIVARRIRDRLPLPESVPSTVSSQHKRRYFHSAYSTILSITRPERTQAPGMRQRILLRLVETYDLPVSLIAVGVPPSIHNHRRPRPATPLTLSLVRYASI